MKGRLIKGVVAWLMSFAMFVGVIGVVSPMRVNAAGNGSGVTLGTPSWGAGRTKYSFPNASVSMTEGKDMQRVFCISVSGGGTFKIKKESFTNNVDLSGVQSGTGNYVDNSGVTGITAITNDQNLVSVTIMGDLKDDDIKNFIKNMVFSRNGVATNVKQKVSVVTSTFDARDAGATALTIDGNVHYYKYVDWDDETSRKYVGKSTVTSLPASSVKDDNTKWTWYYAYNLSKQDKIDVSSDGKQYLKGYLATITSDMEQSFIYHKLGVESGSAAKGAWIGGARTFTLTEDSRATGTNYDQDVITALYPWISGDYAMEWKWMCGPESHDPAQRSFYRIAAAGNGYHGGTNLGYALWNDISGNQEPNNFQVDNSKDAYRQEYVLHYGYTTGGKWNDWYPACNEVREIGMAVPAGYLVEFSPYDISGDGDANDPGEKGGSTVHEDLTIITAEPHIVAAKLNTDKVVEGQTISVVSVTGDVNPGEELIGGTVPVYQWEVFNPTTNSWENAKGTGTNTNSYVPTGDDRGKKLRCHITPSTGTLNPQNYMGDLYVDATGYDDYGKKIEGTPVVYDETGKDIIFEKTNPSDKPEPINPNKEVPPTGGLKINGVPVDNYKISEDKTQIIISKDYLNTLPKGDYPAEIIYTDGSSQKFTISVIDYDKRTIVKNPPLFSMYKEIVLKKKNTFTINLKGISDYAVVSSKITGKGKKAKKIVSIKQQKNGEVLITPKKTGKTQVTCTIIQNGAEYKVVVDIKVLNQYKGTSKNYNLKNKGLVKTSGELPEFNVYKRIVKGKNTKIKFTKVAKDAKVKFYVANKKEAKSLKIGKVKRKGKTVICTVMGKKKGWVHLTAEITQNGKTYYTRLLVRIDDGTWSKKQLKKYLK
ncbi:MAG: hypothetical protein E7271_02210 [Lachnospiraceae bacterium]|nr:hypothetical protein [Lachnospiraceae bacterium]